MTLEFDEQGGSEDSRRILYAKFQKSSEAPSLILFLIKRHIVKDEGGARKLLLAMVVIIFLVSIYLIMASFSGPVFIDTIK